MADNCFLRRIRGAVLAVLMATLPASALEQGRAVWVDAFHAGFKSTGQIDALVANAVAGRYNAIFAEVLAYHDRGSSAHGAYWNSAIVPKASDIVNNIDPLAYLCQRAQLYGIEVHTWLLPFRASSSWPPNQNSILTAHPEWVAVPYPGGSLTTTDGFYMLDPGSPEVQDYLVSIVRELVTNYPINGIHWDYIRYTTTDAGYPSNDNYYYSGMKRYQRIYNTASVPLASNGQWSDFRRRSIDELIRRCRAEIPSITSNPQQPLRFSCSLFATGGAPSLFTSSAAYGYFQNWRLWMENGWLDTSVLMNYKEEHCGSESSMYTSWVTAGNNWRYNRQTFTGQAAYKNTFANSVNQMQYALNSGANGIATYSYYATRIANPVCDDTWVNDFGWYGYVAANLFTATATMPTMPWRNPATATEGTVWGRVKNWDTGDWVDNATVTVGALPSVYTDGNGYYVATLVPATAAGTNYTLAATMPGSSVSRPNSLIKAGDVMRYDLTFNVPPPFIALSTNSITRTVQITQNPANENFQVWNNYEGDMPFTVNDNAAWMTLNPTLGTSTGPADKKSITIMVVSSGLAVGSYPATITINAPNSSNVNRTIDYTLNVVPPIIPGDMDSDGDVDMVDHAAFQLCMSGSGNSPPAGCGKADIDGDGDVDSLDRTKFRNCLSGSDVPGNQNCAN